MGLKHDERLEKLKDGQYRVWHDGQNILVPVGQSITNELAKEIVNTNTRVYGVINKSYFKRPEVDFTNTNVVVERFDRYKLQIWRDELPLNNDYYSLYDDLGIERINLFCEVGFSSQGLYFGNFKGNVQLFYNVDRKEWLSEILHFTDYNNVHLYGDFRIGTNGIIHPSKIVDPNTDLQINNLPIFISIDKATIKNGQSQMEILHENQEYFAVKLNDFKFELRGGE